MQLKVRRGQKAGLTGKVVFVLDVMVGLSAEEKALVDRYRLWGETVYSHSTADEHAKAAQGGSIKAMAAVLADRVLKKSLTIKNLVLGEHIECKDLAELLAVEEQVKAACSDIKRYLQVAQSFDGREEVVEISHAA